MGAGGSAAHADTGGGGGHGTGTRSGGSNRSADAAYQHIDPAKTVPELKGHFTRHAAIVWIGLPLLVAPQALVPFLKPTCANGWQCLPVLCLVLVVAHHLYAESHAWAEAKSLLTEPEVTVVRHRGVLRKRRRLVVLGLLQDLVCYTNLVFSTWTAVCVTHSWERSWSRVPVVGRFVAELVGLQGFVLVCIAGNWISELALLLRMVLSDSAPEAGEWRVPGDQFVELAQFAETALMPSVATLCQEMGEQRRWVFDSRRDARADSDGDFARAREQARLNAVHGKVAYEKLDQFNMFDQQQQRRTEAADTRFVMMQLTVRMLFGCVMQLWVQSAFLMHNFDIFGDQGRVKLAIGMALAGEQLLFCTVRFFGVGLQGFVGIALMTLNLLIVAWVGARVYFAFHCADHVWNLTTGCVDLAAAAAAAA